MLRTGTFSFFIFFLVRRAVDLQSRLFVLLEEYAKLPAADRSADGTVPVATEKQKRAMENAGVKYETYSVREITRSLVNGF